MKNMSFEVRQEIEFMYNNGVSRKDIAKRTGYSLSAIYYEINRGLKEILIGETYEYVWRYSAKKAQEAHDWKAQSKGRPLKLGKHYEFIEQVEYWILKKKYSPYAALEVIRRQGGFCVSVPTLYRYIDNGYFPKLRNVHLLMKSSLRHKKEVTQRRAVHIYGDSIEARPKDVLRRDTMGHWEFDTVIGSANGQKVILTGNERKSRYQIIRVSSDRTAASINRQIKAVFREHGKNIKSIAFDNGSEFSNTNEIKYTPSGRKRCDIYYCHPYCASERGTNENQNRMIRRWIPKGKSMKNLTQKQCDRICEWINTYPRKIFNGKCAKDIYFEK